MWDLIKQFLKKDFAKNSVVSQNIKKRLFYFSLIIETHNYRRVAIFEIPKKFKITPLYKCAVTIVPSTPTTVASRRMVNDRSMANMAIIGALSGVIYPRYLMQNYIKHYHPVLLAVKLFCLPWFSLKYFENNITIPMWRKNPCKSFINLPEKPSPVRLARASSISFFWISF